MLLCNMDGECRRRANHRADSGLTGHGDDGNN